MRAFQPFAMERWQSTYENRVDYNLSESGVHPLSLGELLELAGDTTLSQTLLAYGQSNGSETLRAHIAALYPNCRLENVVATNGSAEANFIALWELVQPGDEIAIIMPTYMQTHGLAQNFGLQVREIWLQEENGWQPDVRDIQRAITERTRLLIVTNPNNPTGAILSENARHALLSAAQRAGAWILADEVYTGAELSAEETASLFGQYERVVATGSLSKAYGLPGLRIGWAVAPPAMAERLWARKDYLTISPGELTDRLAAMALSEMVRPLILARTRAALRRRWHVLQSWLEDTGVFVYQAPRAGAICYARHQLAIPSSDFAERLRAEYSVLVVPGEHFGMSRYLRLGYGLPSDALRAALVRISECLASLPSSPASAYQTGT